MRNPLHKRLPRELRGEFGKYLVIFLMMILSIGFVSGFLVADGSMLTAYQEGFEKYQVEDGHFRLAGKLNKNQIQKLEAGGVTLYENFYLEKDLDNGSKMRIYADRTQVNLVCLMEGRLPEGEGELAIDRMYADNNQIVVGDTLQSGGESWKVTGLVALPDYSCLFENNNDMMFDSVKFGVGIVSRDTFQAQDADLIKYVYAWTYDQEPADESQEKEMAEDFMKLVHPSASLEEFLPRYLNQAITFTGEDMGSDRTAILVFLYIVIAILAFVFGITISNTIVKESNVIGTLLASGYTRGELVRHYMAAPLLVTLVSALVGNILGYSLLKEVCAGMYYGSYSLPTYQTIWSPEAFLLTTLVPLLLMLVVNFTILMRKLSLEPLKFLRRDLKRKGQKRALYLSPRLPFFGRFRMRVIFQNVSNYLLLLVGILFANLLLMFGLMFPPVLSHYQDVLQENLLCNYQYILQMPAGMTEENHTLEDLVTLLLFQYEIETDNEDAEKFSAYSLETTDPRFKTEDVMLYGLQEKSAYIDLDFPEDDSVYISSAYADKCGLKVGDSITLKEAYEDTTYTFTVGGIYDYQGGVTIFMDQAQLNETFDLDRDSFSGYLSDTEITDIDEKYIGSVIDRDSLTKVSRQITVSMGGMMGLVDAFAVVLFLILIYLLSKIIIEKNGQAISMAKILGYAEGEIGRLYILPTSIVVVALLLLSLPLERVVMESLFRVIMQTSVNGWIPLYFDPAIYPKMFALGFGAYLVVAALELWRIRKVPMDLALKEVF